MGNAILSTRNEYAFLDDFVIVLRSYKNSCIDKMQFTELINKHLANSKYNYLLKDVKVNEKGQFDFTNSFHLLNMATILEQDQNNKDLYKINYFEEKAKKKMEFMEPKKQAVLNSLVNLYNDNLPKEIKNIKDDWQIFLASLIQMGIKEFNEDQLRFTMFQLDDINNQLIINKLITQGYLLINKEPNFKPKYVIQLDINKAMNMLELFSLEQKEKVSREIQKLIGPEISLPTKDFQSSITRGSFLG